MKRWMRPAALLCLLAVVLAGCSQQPETVFTSQDALQGQAHASQEISQPSSIVTKPQEDFHYDLLSEQQKTLYNLLNSQSITPQTPYYFAKPEEWDYDDIFTVLTLYEQNHLPLEWCSNIYSPIWDEESSQVCIGIQALKGFDNHGQDEEMAQKFKKAVQQCLDDIQDAQSDYEKIKAIAYWLCEKTEYMHKANPYDDAYLSGLTPQEEEMARYASSEYGALVNGQAICTGYAKAFAYLAQQSGVYSIVVSGDLYGVAHMWNMVWLEGEWYYVDVTAMDDGETVDETYLLAGSEDVEDSHSQMRFGNYPTGAMDKFAQVPVPAKRNGFFAREGTVFAGVLPVCRYIEALPAPPAYLNVQMQDGSGFEQLLAQAQNGGVTVDIQGQTYIVQVRKSHTSAKSAMLVFGQA